MRREATADISYEVAGLAPDKFMRPEWTPDLPRPDKAVSFLQTATGTLCQAWFQHRSAAAERRARIVHTTLSRSTVKRPEGRAPGAWCMATELFGRGEKAGMRIPRKHSRIEPLNRSQIQRRAIAKTRKPFPFSPATVLICKLEFVIFEEVIHKDSEFAHASGECDQRFFTGGAQASIKLF